MYLPKYYANVC
jgi:casein kinase II subunit alpha